METQYDMVVWKAQAEQEERKRRRREFDPKDLSERYGKRLLQLLYPFVQMLSQLNHLDPRPLRTLVQAVEAILTFRDQSRGLLLSELGAQMDGVFGGGGGSRRLETLLHHKGWWAEQIEEGLLQRADERLEAWQQNEQEGLVIWDGTVAEKPESLEAEGLCAVKSSKAGRLTRVKKGYYRPPGIPIFVPGIHGIGVLLAGRNKRQGPPMLAALRWWTSRGKAASHEKDEHGKLVVALHKRWGRAVLHVFDRGYATAFWVALLCRLTARFVLRWQGRNCLLNAEGESLPAWKIAQGKKGLAPRCLWDAVRRQNVTGSVLFFAVSHPDLPGVPLTLVVGRRKGLDPWYLLTNEAVSNEHEAWDVVLAYARRWRIEVTFRNLKGEMAIQSVRVFAWQTRLKLLSLMSLAYAFLMELLGEPEKREREWLIEVVCPRSGWRMKHVELPFSRLRASLAKLWQAFPCWFVRRGALAF